MTILQSCSYIYMLQVLLCVCNFVKMCLCIRTRVWTSWIHVLAQRLGEQWIMKHGGGRYSECTMYNCTYNNLYARLYVLRRIWHGRQVKRRNSDFFIYHGDICQGSFLYSYRFFKVFKWCKKKENQQKTHEKRWTT